MIARRLLIYLLALIVPLAFGALSLRATAAAAAMASAPVAMSSMSGMAGCNQADASKPGKAPVCSDDCALRCAVTVVASPGEPSPFRPFAHLRYEPPWIAVVSRAPKPELPPPRVPPEDTNMTTLQSI